MISNSPSKSKTSILIVEDERIVATDMQQVLELSGYTVCGIAKNSDEALELARKFTPQLVLMDIVIRGDLDGIETAKLIRREIETSIVYLTAYSQEGVLQRAKETNPVAYIVKPFEEATLLSTVEIALHKSAIDAQLTKSRDLFFTTLKSIGDGVISTDSEGVVIFLNRVAEELTGWSADEAAGMLLTDIFQIINEITRESVPVPSLVAMTENRVVPLEDHSALIRRDGSELPIDDAGSPIHDADGNIVGSVLIFRDVADKKKKDRELAEYQQRLESLLKERTAEIDRRIAIEKAVSSLAAQLIRHNEDLDVLIVGALSKLTELLQLSKAMFSFQCSAEWQQWESHQDEGAIASESLIRLAELLRADGGSDRLDITCCLTVEDVATSFPSEESGLADLFLEQGIHAMVTLCIGNQDSPQAFLLLGADSGRNWDIEDLRMVRMLGEVLHSVLDKERLDGEREKLQGELQQAQKMEAIGKLSGGIAHDFNNLLLPILGHSELLMQEHGPNNEAFSEIQKAAKSAASLTKQLLAFSRKQVLCKEILNMREVISDLRNMLQRIIGEDINVELCIANNVPPVIADKSQIEQILLNLSVNARDAMPAGGTLELTVEHARTTDGGGESGEVVITAKDSGTGIDPQTLPNIFEPFFTTKGMQGTGLGLSVVKGIVEQHGGTIRVASVTGEGSTFTVRLPAATAVSTATEETDAPVMGVAARGRGEKILLVEDEPSVKTFITSVLKRHGYNVVPAMSVAEAKTAYDRSTDWDLIFTDAMLPDGTGLEVIDYVLKRQPDSRILLSSGYSDNRALLQMAEDRRLRFLGKPYTVSTLYSAVRDVIDNNVILAG